MSEPTSGSDAVRDLTRQRQPLEDHLDEHADTAAEDHPKDHVEIHDPRHRRAQTPTWVGPDRHPELHRAQQEALRADLLPDQPSPEHDRIGPAAAEVGQAPSILQEAHWSGHSTARTALSLLLIAAAIGTLGAAALTVRSPDGDNASLLAICALATVGLWAIMATTRPMVVDLKGSRLTVHHRDTVDTFDLADPFQPVQIRGSVGSPSWSLALGRIEGGTVVIGSRTVKPAQLHPVVVHYRTKADNLRRSRDERFGR